MPAKRFKIAREEYRDDQGPYGLISLGDLMKYHFAQVAGDKRHPHFWEGEWYCQSEACTVREVTIHLKYEKRAQPRMNCPLCGQVLKFHHPLETVPLLPVAGGEESE
jgi:hypothetical protein